MVERDFGDCVQLVVRTLAVEPDHSLPQKYLTLAMQVTLAIPRQSGLFHDLDRAMYGMNFRAKSHVEPQAIGSDQIAAQWIELGKKYSHARGESLRVSQWGLNRDDLKLWQWTEAERAGEFAAVLTYRATGLPTGLTISSSGEISGTPTVGGTYSVKVTATDTGGSQGSTSFAFTVYTF